MSITDHNKNTTSYHVTYLNSWMEVLLCLFLSLYKKLMQCIEWMIILI
jgi:hypothetical protein